MKKILVTGASGLIGKQTIAPLLREGFDIYCLDSKKYNLFDYDNIEKYILEIKPQYLLHFAWITSGDYLCNPLNEKYYEASVHLLRTFSRCGGKRVVYAGTCFEYEFSDKILSEEDELLPKTFYAQKKIELYKNMKKICESEKLSYAWGRIFYVYGANEREGRLTRLIIDGLSNDEYVDVKYGQLIRDYMYNKDIAEAFVALLLSDVEGAVNICTGKGITLADYARTIAKCMGKENLLRIYSEETNQPLSIIGNPNRLVLEVGYSPQWEYEQGIKEILKHSNI